MSSRRHEVVDEARRSTRVRLRRWVSAAVVVTAGSLAAQLMPFLPASEASAAGPAPDLPSAAEENAEARAAAERQASGSGSALAAGEGKSEPEPAPPQGSVAAPPAPQPPSPVTPLPPPPTDKLPDGEVPSLRTETSRTFDLGDGRRRTEIGTGVMNVRKPDGRLVPVDLGFAKGSDGRHRIRAAKVDLAVADAGSDPTLVAVNMGPGRSVRWGLRGGGPAPARAQGGRLSYDGVLPEVDLTLESLVNGLKESVIIRSPRAATRYTFRLDVDGVTPSIDERSGDVLFRDAAGAIQGRIPRPTVWDSSPGPYGGQPDPLTAPVSHRLEPVRGGREGASSAVDLVVDIDPAWLRSPERVFPVTLDPTFTQTIAVDDAWTGRQPACGGGSDWSGWILKTGGSDCDRRTLIKFDTGPINHGYVLAAQVTLRNTYSYSCNASPTSLHRMIGNWAGPSLTFPHADAHVDPNPLDTISYAKGRPGCDADYVRWGNLNAIFPHRGITDMVQSWVQGGANLGVQLRGGEYKEYFSSEFGDGPKLEVIWSPRWAIYLNSAELARRPTFNSPGGHTMLIRNAGVHTWTAGPVTPDRASYGVSYRLHDCAGNPMVSASPKTDLPHDVPHDGLVWVTATIEPLPPGCYILDFDVVADTTQFGRAWFSDDNFLPNRVRIDVFNVPPEIRRYAPGGETPTNRPVLSADAVNPDGWPWKNNYYLFKICTDEAMSAGCQESGWRLESTWTPEITWSIPHWWQVQVSEGQPPGNDAISPWTPPLQLTAVVPQEPPLQYGDDPYGSDDGGVNMANGNFTTSVTDVSVPAVGGQLGVTRTYNSLDTANRWFGTGWSGPWDVTLTREDSTRTVLVSFADGHQQRYGANPDGTFSASAGRLDRLSGSAPAGYTLVLGDGSTNVFDGSTGKLTRMTDPHGRVTSFGYDSAGKLSTVRDDSSGRTLSVRWSGSHIDRISTAPVTDTESGTAAPIVVEYRYTGDRLTSVCGPRSLTECTVYEYAPSGDPGAGRMSGIKRAKGNYEVTLGYQPDGTVAWRRDGMGNQTSYADDRTRLRGLYRTMAPGTIYDSAVSGELASAQPKEVQLLGVGGVPANGVEAVALSISLPSSSVTGYVTAYPSDGQPNAALLMLNPGEPVAQTQIVAPGPNGKIRLFAWTNGGTVPVVVKAVGWFGDGSTTGGATYHPARPGVTIIDTRAGQVVGPFSSPFAANQPRRVPVVGAVGYGGERPPVPAGAVAAVVNIAGIDAAGAGSLVAWDSGTAPDLTTAPLVPTNGVSSQAIVPLDASGAFQLMARGSSTHVTVDVIGWFTDAAKARGGAVFRKAAHTGIFDSRPGSQIGPFSTGWLGAMNRNVPIAGQGPVPGRNVAAIAGAISSPASVGVLAIGVQPAYGRSGSGSTMLTRDGRGRSNGLLGNGLSRDGHLAVSSFGFGSSDLLLVASGWYEQVDLVVTRTSPRGFNRTYRYDPQGRLAARTDELGNTRTYEYDSYGYLKKTVDETGRVVHTWRNARGNIVATRTEDGPAEAGKHTWFEYYLNPSDPLDRRNDKVIAVRDGRSTPAADGMSSADDRYKTTYTYNADGTLASVKSPATPDFPSGRTASMTYTTGTEPAVDDPSRTMPRGLVRTETDEAGHVTRYDYNASGDLARETLPSGLVKQYGYDEVGRRTQEREISDSYPAGLVTATGYDAHNRVVYRRHPTVNDPHLGRTHTLVERTTYDANGNVTSEESSDRDGWDPARITTTTYDDADRPVDVKNPVGTVTRTEYDASSNISRRCVGPTASNPCDSLAQIEAYTYSERDERRTTTVKGFADDPANAPGATRDVLVESRGYDKAGRLASVIDARGREITTTYVDDTKVADRVLKAFRNPDGSTRDLVLEHHEYDLAGNETKRQSANNTRTTLVDVDAAGRVAGETLDPAPGRNRRLTYGYTPDGLTSSVTATEAGRTESTTIEYSPLDQPTKITVSNGTRPAIVSTIAYDQRGLATSTRTPRGNTTTVVNDEAGNPITVTQPAVTVEAMGTAATTTSPVTKYAYDTFGSLVFTRDARGGETRIGYTATGLPALWLHPAYTTPAGNVITPLEAIVYDAWGNPRTHTDRRGRQATFTFDKRNRLAQRTDPPAVTGRPAGTTQLRYDDNGNQIIRTDPVGAVQVASYDDLNRRTGHAVFERSAPPASGTQVYATRFEYDDAGGLTKTIDPTNVVTTATFDGLGARRSVTDGAGGRSTFDYDVADRVVKTVDPEGRQRFEDYDGAGRVERRRVLNPAGTQLWSEQYGLDADGNVTSVTNANGIMSTATYDALGRVTTIEEPKAATAKIRRSFGYDAVGNRTRVTDGNGHVTWTTYQAWNLPGSVVEPSTPAHPNEADRRWTTTYDAGGLPVIDVAPGGVTRTRTFDAIGLLRSESGEGGGSVAASRTFDYDAAGRRTSFSRPGGTVAVSYNDRGLPLRVTDATTTEYTYDGAGRTLSRTDAAGASAFTYDRGQLKTVADPLTGSTATYTYWPDGDVKKIDRGAGKVAETFDYDPLDRLQKAEVRNGTSVLASTTYAYDAVGNLTSKTAAPAGVAGAGTHSYGYDQANRLTSWTAPGGLVTGYGWDDNGNRTSAGATTAVYDARNRLTSSTTGGVATTYTWTPRGTLASTKVGTAAPTTSTFDAFDRTVTDGSASYTYDGLDRIRTTGAATFAWSGLSQELAADGTTTYSHDPGGRLIAAKTGATASGVVTNNRGDVVGTAAVGATALSASRAYDPWGTATATNGTMPARGYQSDWTNPATGRVDMNARQYTPATGTFTARDSVEDPAMGNRYGYTAGNPITYVDPTGHLRDPSTVRDVSHLITQLAPAAGGGAAVGAAAIGVGVGFLPAALVFGGVFIGASVILNWGAISGGETYEECGTACWEQRNRGRNRAVRAQPCYGNGFGNSACAGRGPTPVRAQPCYGSCRRGTTSSGYRTRVTNRNRTGAPRRVEKPKPKPPPCVTSQCYWTKFNRAPKPDQGSQSREWRLDAASIETLRARLPIFDVGPTAAEASGEQNPTTPDVGIYQVEQDQPPPPQEQPKLATDGAGARSGSRGGGTPSAVAWAESAADFARLTRQLQFDEAASVFDRSGGLQQSLIDSSTPIIRGPQLGNQQVVKALTADGSNIADWAKYTTQTFQSPSGPFQVHFYQNSATGAVNYAYDYKVVFNGPR